MDRRRLAGLILGAVAASAALGGLAGARIASPADVAARTAPPEPSPILVPVEQRVLATKVVTRGTGRYGTPMKLSVPPSSLKGSPGIVATAPAPGTTLKEGDVIATASGRPVFVLRGAAPMARDLGQGTSGQDVRQLEDALVRLGFGPGPPDGTYDAQTAAAVAAWYAASGYPPFAGAPDQVATARARESEWRTASLEALSATDALAAVDASRAAAQAALASGQERAAAAVRAAERARAEAGAAAAGAAAEVASKQAALDSLQAGGQATAGEVVAAQAELRLAKANAETVRLSGERAVDEAAVSAAEAAAAMPAAQAALVSAEVARTSALRAAELRADSLDAAVRERDLARAGAGAQVPADEVVFLPVAALRVAEALVGPGDPALGALANVTDQTVHVEGGLALADAKLVKVGMAVRVEEPDLGIGADGTVQTVANAAGTNGVDGFHVSVSVALVDAPPNLVGASVRLTIPVASSAGPVLAVPVSAVTLGPDGASRVQKDAGAGFEFVVVAVGLSADGYVAITPPSGALRAGDLVVVGTNLSAVARSPQTDQPGTTTTTPTRAA